MTNPPATLMAVTHIAAPHIVIGDRYWRQRCGWCGETLAEYDLTRIAVPEGTDPTPATWPTGALVTLERVAGVDGIVSWTREGNQLPDDACAVNPLTLVSFDAGDR